MTRHARTLLLVSLVSFLAIAVRADAGGPLLVFAPGQPYRWANGGVNIHFNPDQGGLGPMDNAAAVAQTAAAFAAWGAIPTATATHVDAGALPFDVNETNFEPFLNPVAPDGLSAIVFDADGAIFDLLFGPGSGVLGFAGPEWINTQTGVITEGVAFMNGGALLGPGAFPLDEFLSVQVHEFGHYQNLAHTVVNGQIPAGPDTNGPSPFNTFPSTSLVGRIETMYPFLFITGGQATPHADDIAMLSSLYPEPGFAASTGTITGRILGPNGTTPLTGVNVIARNVANPFDDAVSAISSDFTDDFTPGAPFVGVYTLRGLTPGASYAVFVDQILIGGFSTPPRTPLPGPEEFYSGAGESNDLVADNPNVFAPVAAVAGAVVSNIDIIFNRLPPGPIPLGDESSVELFLEFPIRFCGQTWDSVFVNSNGNLTFGAGSSGAFLETAAGMLAGPPRIAGLWDDLNPEAGGEVSFSQDSSSFTVRFTDVPEFSVGGANSFTITLRRSLLDGSHGFALDGGRFTLDYGALSATDGLAGYSCGGKITTGFELETNLSALRLPFVLGLEKPAVYEWFTAADNDLDNERFDVLTPKPFRDEFEPNNTQASARLVKLPFSTEDKFTALRQGGDVDFYRFRANAGEYLAIETVPGTQAFDTLVGFFDSAGNLLLADDDGGAGLLSRIIVQVPVDGDYAVGVTSFPDFGFTGAGDDYGRYVLSIRTYTGTILPLVDDDSLEVPLTTFRFPFQGTKWSSVWVNGNGNLTFGAGDGDFSETVPEFLNGAPRIAPLWDDLFPLAGLVIVNETHGKLQVHFVSVPEFLALGTNSFTVQLDSKGDVSIDYGATNRSDGLAGVTPGGGVADPGPTDLSRAWWLWALGTTYEQFAGSFGTYGGVDLSFRELKFRKP
jgi:hypothetical protein